MMLVLLGILVGCTNTASDDAEDMGCFTKRPGELLVVELETNDTAARVFGTCVILLPSRGSEDRGVWDYARKHESLVPSRISLRDSQCGECLAHYDDGSDRVVIDLFPEVTDGGIVLEISGDSDEPGHGIWAEQGPMGFVNQGELRILARVVVGQSAAD